MAMTFLINKNSTLPSLRVEVINNGRDSYDDVWYALQAANVTFSMWNKETGVKRIANAKADIVQKSNEFGCTDEYIIEYKWKERDTKEAGLYIGSFTITLDKSVKINGTYLPKGKLIVPISEELEILITEGSIKV